MHPLEHYLTQLQQIRASGNGLQTQLDDNYRASCDHAFDGTNLDQ